MAMWQWSTTPGNNANVGSINWAEGMPPSAVNNSARQQMADVADFVNNPGPEWYQHDAVTFASGTTFTVAGTDVTAYYLPGRRLRAVVTAGTIYGTVVSATFSTNTTITAVWDSGSLDAGLSSLKAGILAPTNLSIPNNLLISASAVVVTSLLTSKGGAHIDGVVSVSATVTTPMILTSNTNGSFVNFSCSGGAKYAGVSVNNFLILAQNGATTLITVDNSGNLTAAANITANSDERFKDEWVPLPDDFVDRLALLLSGSYTRTDMLPPERQVGIGAQTFLKTFPELAELVHEDDNGTLSFAYGQGAMVACVELAKEVRRLRKLIEKGKA